MEFLTIISNTVFINNLLLVGFFTVFVILFGVESRNPKSPVSWIDLLIDPLTNKVSITKIGQLIGIRIGGWVVITMAQIKESYGSFPMVFTAYLAFLGGVYAFSNWMKGKKDDDEDKH